LRTFSLRSHRAATYAPASPRPPAQLSSRRPRLSPPLPRESTTAHEGDSAKGCRWLLSQDRPAARRKSHALSVFRGPPPPALLSPHHARRSRRFRSTALFACRESLSVWRS